MELFDAIKENPVQAAGIAIVAYVALDHLKEDTKKSREKAEELENSIQDFKNQFAAANPKAVQAAK